MGATGNPGAAGTNGAAASSSAAGMTGAFMAISAISSISTAYSQSRALKAAGDYQETVANTNAEIANIETEQILSSADASVSRRDMARRAMIGSARARAGASGTDVNSGSNALITIGEDFAGKIDALTIRNNAARAAWGYKVQSQQDTFEGQFAKMTANNQAQQRLLTGGVQAIQEPIGIYSSYAKWSRSMSGGRSEVPFDMSTSTKAA